MDLAFSIWFEIKFLPKMLENAIDTIEIDHIFRLRRALLLSCQLSQYQNKERIETELTTENMWNPLKTIYLPASRKRKGSENYATAWMPLSFISKNRVLFENKNNDFWSHVKPIRE